MAHFSMETKSEWGWTLMILQPEFITRELLWEAMTQVKVKGKAQLANQVRLEELDKGTCAQILYLGPYDKEVETIA